MHASGYPGLPPLVPLAAVGIAVVTAVAISLPLVFGVDATGDAFIRRALPPLLFFVAAASIVTTRVLVLPQTFRRWREGPTARDGSLSQAADSARLIAFPFALSAAVYGLVAVVITGQWWLALPFAALGLIILFVNSSYIDRQVGALVLEARARGEA